MLKFHLHVYITALEQSNLKVGAKEVQNILDMGWTLTQLCQELDQDPDKYLEPFGSPPGRGVFGLGPRLGRSALADDTPDFTIKEMHRQLVKFIVVNDQVSTYLLSTILLLIGIFRQ